MTNRSALPSDTPRAHRYELRSRADPSTGFQSLPAGSTGGPRVEGPVKAARAKIKAYKTQSRSNEHLLKDGLGALLTWLPVAGKTSVAKDIVATSSDEELYGVFMNLFTGLVVPLKSRSKPPSTVESSLPRQRENVDAVASTLGQPERRDSVFATRLQLRDNYRCVITGHMNTDHWRSQGRPNDVAFGPTEGAHIIPFAFASWSRTSEAPRGKSNTWTLLYKCFPALRDIVSVGDLNNPRNGITLRDSVHHQFGQFTIALKPTKIQNEYEVKTYPDYPTPEIQFLPSNRRIRFSPNAEHELPSPAILEAHWRICEIFNASAMGETIEHHMRDWEELKDSACAVIREDGATDLGGLLDVALWSQVPA